MGPASRFSFGEYLLPSFKGVSRGFTASYFVLLGCGECEGFLMDCSSILGDLKLNWSELNKKSLSKEYFSISIK